jgi:hypothetical protein
MNKHLQRMVSSGDKCYEPLFNEWFKVKRAGQYVITSGWLNTDREQEFQIRRALALNRWLKTAAVPTFPPCRTINGAIYSVAFNMIKFKNAGGTL